MREIVVGVDESGAAAEALRWAARESGFHDAELVAVMAWGFLDQHHGIVGERFDPSYGESDAQEVLRSLIVAAIGQQAAEAVRARVVCDLPGRALLEASAGADLLVVGARGVGGFRGLLLGSVSQHCLHHASIPTVVVREGHERSTASVDRIVAAVDGSDTAQRALGWALAEGRARKAAVEVVHVWQVPYVAYYPEGAGLFNRAIYEEASRQVLDDTLAAVDTDGLPEPVKRTSLCGGAAAGILDAARDADLLVLGSRGLGGVKGMLLGSVTMQATHHARCPVVVVPPAR